MKSAATLSMDSYRLRTSAITFLSVQECKELEHVEQLLNHEKLREEDNYVRWHAFIYRDEGVIEPYRA